MKEGEEGVLGYDILSNTYDHLYFEEQAAKVTRARECFEGTVVDLGCGTLILPRILNVENYVGIDVSRAMLEKGLEKAPWADVVRGDAHNIPLRKGVRATFVLITVVQELDVGRLFNELRSYSPLKVVVTTHKSMPWLVSSVLHYAIGAGFKVTSVIYHGSRDIIYCLASENEA